MSGNIFQKGGFRYRRVTYGPGKTDRNVYGLLLKTPSNPFWKILTKLSMVMVTVIEDTQQRL